MHPTSMSIQPREDGSVSLPGESSADPEIAGTHGSGQSPLPTHSADDYLEQLESSTAELHRFVALRITNKADAEDIAQQALLQAFANLSAFRGENFRGWLYAIARRLIIDHYRSRNRVHLVEVTETAFWEREPSLHTRPDAVHSRCDCRAWLGEWVDCITQHLRLEEQVAVLLADVHGYSDKASAAELKITLPSFKLLLHGARARLNEISGHSCVLLNRPVGERTSTACDDGGTRCRCSQGRAQNGAEEGSSAAPRSVPGQRRCHCNQSGFQTPAVPSAASSRCCAGCSACLSRKCCFGVNCRLGIKCCRQAPKLLELRTRLLRALVLNAN